MITHRAASLAALMVAAVWIIPAWSQAKEGSAMLEEVTSNEGFEVTEGLDLIWSLAADPANIVFRSPEATLTGFTYYDAEYRWPAVRGNGGEISVVVPRAGWYHPAVVVYDSGGRQAFEMLIDGEVVGRFVATEDDNRQRVHLLSKRIQFTGGETVTVRAGANAWSIVEDIMLLGLKPPLRGRRFEVTNVEAGSVRRDGEDLARITWITTWPARCSVEVGPTQSYGQRIDEEEPLANHRVLIPGLRPGQTYHYRVIAPRPDGSELRSPDMTFVFSPPQPFVGTAQRERTSLTVQNPHRFPVARIPVTCGVPFAAGELGDADHIRLLDAAGREIPLQAKVTGRWQDGSVKWALLTFMAEAARRQTVSYTLEYGAQVSRRAPEQAVGIRREGARLTIDSGPMQASFDADQSGFPALVLAGGRRYGGERMMGARLTDDAGIVYTTNNPPELLEVEEAGPLRVIVRSAGHHLSEGHEVSFAYDCRFEFYAGCDWIRAYYTWGNDREEPFSRFQSITLNIPLEDWQNARWAAGAGGGKQAAGVTDFILEQFRDDSFSLVPWRSAGDAPLRRADGWVDVSTAPGGMLVAVRDFWQLYPKSLGISDDELVIGICPDFPAGEYDSASKLDEIKLSYYLRDGAYTIKRGVRKQHELLLAFHGATPGEPAQTRLATVFQEPLIAVCGAERYADTAVFGPLVPPSRNRVEGYDAVCERVIDGFVQSQESGKWYGMHNYGDWWGERKVNWGNGEYDWHHAFLMQFVRTGDRKWYFAAEKAARHAIDIDTCHYGPDAGGYYLHAMGHVGGYFDEPHEGEGIPWGGFSPSHTWTEGFCDWYFLSGDPTSQEAAGAIAGYYNGAYLNNYDFSNCRDNGWNLILTLAAYRATGDPYHLNAARMIVERTLERQTPRQRGWHRQMVPEHCFHTPRHRGEANFMLGVLCNGLELYYEEVPDKRVAEAIIGGANQAIGELWVPEARGFRYTSCPTMSGYTANNDMTVEPLFFAWGRTGKREYGEIALEAMQAAFPDLGSVAHLRWMPRLLYWMNQVMGDSEKG